MTIFRPTANRVCKLNFDDKFFYELPLHEETARELGKIADKQRQFTAALNENDPDAFDKAYNAALDALDEILGEGAGADIMSIYEKPSLFDVAEVVSYIAGEYKEAYSAYLNAHKVTGTIPSASRGRR